MVTAYLMIDNCWWSHGLGMGFGLYGLRDFIMYFDRTRLTVSVGFPRSIKHLEILQQAASLIDL